MAAVGRGFRHFIPSPGDPGDLVWMGALAVGFGNFDLCAGISFGRDPAGDQEA